jgi:hypothetical protein
VQTRARRALALALRCSLSVIPWTGVAPESAPDPDGPADANEGSEPLVDPALAHAGSGDEIAYRNAFVGCEAQGSPEQRVRSVLGLLLMLGAVRGVLVFRGL